MDPDLPSHRSPPPRGGVAGGVATVAGVSTGTTGRRTADGVGGRTDEPAQAQRTSVGDVGTRDRLPSSTSPPEITGHQAALDVPLHHAFFSLNLVAQWSAHNERRSARVMSAEHVTPWSSPPAVPGPPDHRRTIGDAGSGQSACPASQRHCRRRRWCSLDLAAGVPGNRVVGSGKPSQLTVSVVAEAVPRLSRMPSAKGSPRRHRRARPPHFQPLSGTDSAVTGNRAGQENRDQHEGAQNCVKRGVLGRPTVRLATKSPGCSFIYSVRVNPACEVE
ncbi:hypothetical protein SAMN05216188_12911 [Lentzea xinjiangensis]|uniref:Uncharacterized protein n=1 Tax=Lentzea xinjiangensis TaxID=402600 RepID=A0A1H9VY45_9PSEU|nr:hypothetical protein SAMN05216188_12911 [Lentzea xinjiangensis]